MGSSRDVSAMVSCPQFVFTPYPSDLFSPSPSRFTADMCVVSVFGIRSTLADDLGDADRESKHQQIKRIYEGTNILGWPRLLPPVLFPSLLTAQLYHSPPFRTPPRQPTRLTGSDIVGPRPEVSTDICAQVILRISSRYRDDILLNIQYIQLSCVSSDPP